MSAVSYISTLNEEEKERVRRIRQERTELAREERHRNLESLHNLELVPSASFSLSLFVLRFVVLHSFRGSLRFRSWCVDPN
jgi:hypothetical protein